MGEAQPRYSLLISPALALLAAIVIFPHDIKNQALIEIKDNSTHWWLVSGFIGLFCIYAAVALGAKALPTSEGVNKLVKLSAPSDALLQDCSSKSVQMNADYKKIRVTFEDKSRCALLFIPAKKSAETLSFYVSGSKFPYKFEPKYASPFRYEIIVEGVSLISNSLNTDSVKWESIKLPEREIEGVYLLIERNEMMMEKDFVDISLLNMR